jgi:predicted 3-demethylubiquinone-9 3-methyltransferase (glyoxalase superfamily)
MKKGITIELWMDSQAEEAAQYYVNIFKDSELGPVRYYSTETPSEKPIGSVITADFTVNGQRFQALNGGPMFNKFTEAISFVVECDDQAEVDYYWERLTADGGQESQCGWLKDKYGVSWQIVPEELEDILYQEDQEKGKRAMEALLTMQKIDLAAIKAAVEGN